MDQETYSLKELAELTGIEPRTIRSYIAKGLLLGPLSRGRNASYSEHHLERLQEIRSLKEQGLTLDEIRQTRLHARRSADLLDAALEFGHPLRAAPDEGGEPLLAAFKIEEAGNDAPLLRLLRILQGAVSTRAAHRRSRTELWTQVEVTPEIQLHVRGELRERERELVRQIAEHMRDILLGEGEAPL